MTDREDIPTFKILFFSCMALSIVIFSFAVFTQAQYDYELSLFLSIQNANSGFNSATTPLINRLRLFTFLGGIVAVIISERIRNLYNIKVGSL